MSPFAKNRPLCAVSPSIIGISRWGFREWLSRLLVERLTVCKAADIKLKLSYMNCGGLELCKDMCFEFALSLSVSRLVPVNFKLHQIIILVTN